MPVKTALGAKVRLASAPATAMPRKVTPPKFEKFHVPAGMMGDWKLGSMMIVIGPEYPVVFARLATALTRVLQVLKIETPFVAKMLAPGRKTNVVGYALRAIP